MDDMTHDDEDRPNNTPFEDVASLVQDNLTSTTTDVITDLKTGIYNLFVSLFHQYVPLHGPEGAIRMATDFLEEITINFRQALVEDE